MAEAPNKHAKWTDTEEAIVEIFPTDEAAEILGRTREGVRSRRCKHGLGPAHGNRKAKKRLRREFFASGDGLREEVVPPPALPMCRFCPGKPAYTRGVCKACYRWIQRTVESGYVTWEIAEMCWLSARR
jgi:hypothetical protein